jgi:hypothetical protein
MSYYNRDNIFNFQPVVRGEQGIPGSIGTTGPKGDTGERGDTGIIGNTIVFRLYQELVPDSGTSWDSVNGYYGLAKDTYPAVSEAYATKAVSTWTQRTSPVNNNWFSVCWSPELSLFVACGSGSTNKIITSSNGTNWTTQVTPNINGVNYEGICWSPKLKLFVAVGYGGSDSFKIITSPDGINWTAQSIGINIWLWEVCWSSELSLFVATGASYVFTSPDGINWSAIQINGNWLGVCWSPELSLFVAVSNSGSTRVITSHDAINWTYRPNSIANDWQSVCWSIELGLFVAVSTTGTNRVMTSTDGINWISRNASTNKIWRSVVWSAELGIFCAVAQNIGSPNIAGIMTSYDGINWFEQLVPSNNHAYYGICWSPELGLFCSVGNSAVIITSSLKGRIPTSYNVFDSPFNSIDERGNWTIQQVLKGTTTTNSTITPNVYGLNLYSLGNTLGTTITNLTGATTNQELVLYFSNSNTTISSNNSIRLQSGITFSGTTFDTLRLLYTGNEWVELSRSVNQ